MQWSFVLITPENCQGVFIEIRGAKYHHLVRVRRLRVGDVLRAALPDGKLFTAEVVEISTDLLRAQITAEEVAVGLSPCRITLYQAILKGDKMEFVVQKASELGATTLTPLIARRSIPQWTSAQAVERAERWQRIADASAIQCERSIPLQVTVPSTVQDTLDTGSNIAFLLHERTGQPLPNLVAQYPSLREIGMYIGPEGGWDDDEVCMLCDAGVIPVHLGGRILRAETASVVAVTLAQYLWGDLGLSSLE